MSIERLSGASEKRAGSDCRITNLTIAAAFVPLHAAPDRVCVISEALLMTAEPYDWRNDEGVAGNHNLSMEDDYFLVRDMTPRRISLVSDPQKAPGI
jgi:hypothetical protein